MTCCPEIGRSSYPPFLGVIKARMVRQTRIHREAIMLLRIAGILWLGTLALASSVAAQSTPPPSAITRTEIAATKLLTVAEVPLHFKAVSISLPSGEISRLSAANGILYQMSGSTEVSDDRLAKTLNVGEGLFIAAGRTATLKAGGETSTLLHFFVAPAADLERAAHAAPATVKELYRTSAPIPGLKPGNYDLNLTRITFPARTPSNQPHHRSGAALYYIVSGTGANTVDGKTETKAPGSLIYEPFGLVHQWGNPSSEPFTFLAFNINPEGVAAVLPGAPAKPQ
jgi:quercetin dioxygenase-like cupin family protein